MNADNQVAIASADEIVPLVELTRRGSAVAKEKAAEALWNLALNADNSVAIRHAGGIAPLVELTHSGSAGSQEQAAGALWVLARNADNQVAIVRAGGIATLVELTHIGSAGAQEKAAGALKNLALNADNRVAIAQAGGIAPLVELTCSASAGAQEQAAGALKNLALNADNSVAIAQAGGIAPLVELTRGGDAYAKQYAAEALWVLAANADNKVAMKVAGDAAAAEEDDAQDDRGGKGERIAVAEKRAADKAATERAAAEKAAKEELRRRATALGLLQVLTTADIADDATLEKSIAFCDEHGVTNVSDIVQFVLVDDFVRHLDLRTVPERRLRSILQAPTSGRAAQISNRLVAASMSNRLVAASMSWFGPPASENKADENASLSQLPAAENDTAVEEDGFQDGFTLEALRPETDAGLLQSLETLLQTERPEWLGKGRDVSKKCGPYDSLKLACAWKVQHPTLWSKYTAGVKRVQQELKRLQNKGILGKDVTNVPGLPVKTTDRVGGFTLSQACNEAILLHGPNPERLHDLLAQGFNERFSGTGAGTAFGDGVYLAEDAGKTDQYVSADSAYDPSNDLHKRLYDETVRHPDDVFYVLVVRAALGFPVRTQKSGQKATSMDGGAPIFPINYRELSAVPGVTPKILHHSLIAELGKGPRAIARYREFVLFHSDQVYIDYVIAYHRCNGGQKLRTADSPYQA